MATILIRTNVAAPVTLINDLGFDVPAAGATAGPFTNSAKVQQILASARLGVLTTDNAFGAGSNTLIVELDGVDVDPGELGSAAGTEDMVGATGSTDGQRGLIPKPLIADRFNFFRGDGVYVDVTSNIAWKEMLLADGQLLDGAAGGILQAILAAIVTNLTVGDTFEVTDGATTETFTAVGAAPAAFQFVVGGSAAVTTTNLVAAINLSSTLWSAVETSGLDTYFSALTDPQLVIFRTVIPGGAADDRVFGVIAGGQADLQVVEFATGEQNYQENSGTQGDLDAADGGSKLFGFGRAEAQLQTGETHRIAEDLNGFTWDGDDLVWNQTSGGGVTGASNVGVGGVGVFKQLAAGILEFRNVNAASTKITVALDAANNEIDVDANPADEDWVMHNRVFG